MLSSLFRMRPRRFTPPSGIRSWAMPMFVFLAATLIAAGSVAWAQGPEPAKGPAAAGNAAAKTGADAMANAALQAADKENAARGDAQPTTSASPAGVIPKMNLVEMYFKGGWLMYPITFMSFVVVAFTIERAIGTRRSKIIPHELVENFGRMSASAGGFDPRKAYRICQHFPCSASAVIRAVLLKVGRPHDEVELTAQESIQRETWRLNYNVRPLSLSVTVTPLMGLLGTVQGMIIAFYMTAHAPVGADRALVLADGIYLKLITTYAGLIVAIPALFSAHFFEGKIQSLMHEVDELVQGLLPQVEKYEGRLRISRTQLSGAVEPPPVARHAEPLAQEVMPQVELA
jgi:biopolymer transport protein ExbB